MNRISYVDKLTAWVNSSRRKPLVLEGARQVGKTWLMQEFAKKHFENVVYARFDKDKLLRNIFTRDFDLERIVRDLQIRFNTTIDPQNTILLLDEIQSCKDAITALKYFCEERPDLPIIAAGSLLGLEYRDDDQERSSNGDDEETTGFPVGKVNMLEVHPFSFVEFLDAVGQESLAACVRQCDWERIATFGEPLTDLLKHYYVVGGMPEAVDAYRRSHNFKEVREIHHEILVGYQRDISKHAPKSIIPKIELCWNSIPAQLAKENKKFIYAALKKGGRSSEFRDPLRWLEDAGLIGRVKRVSAPKLPLDGYADGAFKVYLLDVGLLSTMSGLAPEVVLEGSRVFTEFKGALTEQYVYQQLKAETELVPYYYSQDDSQCEVDFLVQLGMDVCPLEVKAEENVHSQSLKSYRTRFAPRKAFRTSMKDFEQQEQRLATGGICRFANLPLVGVQGIGNAVNHPITQSPNHPIPHAHPSCP